jgi:hypothetical protein
MHTLQDHHSNLLIRTCQKIGSLGNTGINTERKKTLMENQQMVHLKYRMIYAYQGSTEINHCIIVHEHIALQY